MTFLIGVYICGCILGESEKFDSLFYTIMVIPTSEQSVELKREFQHNYGEVEWLDNYYVYVHIAPNQKCYIGITCQNPMKRWHGGSGYRQQPKFYNAIKKYGWDNFYHGIVLEGLSESNACAIEQYLIDYFDTISNGYNQTTGGTSGYSQKHSEEAKLKISKALKGRKKSEEHRLKSCEQLAKNRLNRQKKVCCVETGETFESIKQAANAYNLNPAHIAGCCNGKRKTHGKLHWKYAEVV